MKVLITGGAGYLGAALVQELQYFKEIREIIVYDNLSRGNYSLFVTPMKGDTKVTFVKADILDTRRLKTAVSECDCIVHLAARVTTPFADSEAHSFDQVNHWGTSHLVDALEHNPKRKLIFVSSAAVYGNTHQEIDHDAPTSPSSFYGVSKLAAEEEVKRLADIMPYVILRSGNVYGYSPALRIDAVINRFAFEAMYSGRIRVFGSGKQLRPFIHISTEVKTIAKLLLQSDFDHRTLNLAEHNLSVRDLVDELKSQKPRLELIFENKEQQMHSLMVAPPSALFASLEIAPMPLSRGIRQLLLSMNFGQ